MASIFFVCFIVLLAEMAAEALIHHVQVSGKSGAKVGKRFSAVIFKEEPVIPGLELQRETGK